MADSCMMVMATAKQGKKPVTDEWLRMKYVVEGLDCTAIARIVNRDPKSVWNWLKDYGIPTKPRGYNKAVQFKPGHNGWQGRRHTDVAKAKIRAASIADGRVPYLRNGEHHLKGKRGADTPNWRGGISPERQTFYGSNEWRTARKTAYIAANGLCQRCGIGPREARAMHTSLQVHHMVSFKVRELRCELSNLRILCGPCHRFVHSRKNVAREFIR